MRVRLALALKGIKNYEFKKENLRDRSPLLLQTNPIHKKIPISIHNRRPISESFMIDEYIDEIWQEPRDFAFYPLILTNVSWRGCGQTVQTRRCFECAKRICRGVREEDVEMGRVELMESLRELEGELGEKKYFDGEEMGFVDVALLPFFAWLYCLEMRGKFSV